MSENRPQMTVQSAVEVVAAVVDVEQGEKVLRIYREEQAPVDFVCMAHGTARTEMLDLLGIGETAKAIVMCMVSRQTGVRLLKRLGRELEMRYPGRGIAFAIPITGIGLRWHKLLTAADEEQKEVSRMHETEKNDGFDVVAVVMERGYTNVAMDAARCALRCGAEKVSLYCLEDYDSMPMGVEDRTECEEDGIEIHAGWGQTEILAENGKCSGIRFRKCLSVRNAEGRFAPTFDDNATEEVPCDMVLYCIGQKVDWKGLLTGTAVELNPNGTAKADPVTYQTAEPDIFVGGDVYTGQKFAIDAIAAGKQGAVSLHRWVQDATLTIGRDKREFIELDKNNLLLEEASYDNTPRQRIGYNETLRKTFKDGRVAFTEEQVTARCLGCGASIVDPNKCIGCGVCTTKCAFDAIHLHRERPECSTMYACEDKMKAILPYMIKRKIRIRRAKKAEKRNG